MRGEFLSSITMDQSTSRQQKNATVTFCEAQYDRMADMLASALAKGSGTDDILFGNRILNFEVDGRETRKEVYTGVEFLGSRERYTEIRFLPETVRLVGVYTLSGNSVRVKMNCEKILEKLQTKNIIR